MRAVILVHLISKSRFPGRIARSPRLKKGNSWLAPSLPENPRSFGVSINLPTARGALCLSPFRIPKNHLRCRRSAAASRRFRSSIPRVANSAGCSRCCENQRHMNQPRKIFASAFAISAIALIGIAAEVATRPPAPSLMRPASAEKDPDADGFIQRWLILEPIRSNTQLTDNAVKEAVKKEHFPNQLSVIPRDGDKVAVGSEELAWHAVDTKEYNVNLYHFAYALNKPTSFVLFWAVTIVNCPEEMRDVRLAIGSNAASIWWVNGQEIIGIYGDRQTDLK